MTNTATASTETRGAEGELLSLVYISDATTPFSEVDLALLLAVSRSNNEPSRITGMLLHDDGRFIQALEGPEAAVRRALEKIAADPRHTHVQTLQEERIDARRFGSWAMGYRSVADLGGEAKAWFGSPEALAPQEGSRAAELLQRFTDR